MKRLLSILGRFVGSIPWILLCLFASLAYGQPTAKIVRPSEMADVPWKPCISVAVSDDHARLVPIIHPLETEDYHVEPALTPAGGTAIGKTYIAEADAGRFENQVFEIRIALNPKRPLRNGSVLDGWPEAESYSQLVRVVRRDAASDGCSGPKADPPPKAGGEVRKADGQLASGPSPANPGSGIWLPILAGAIAVITVITDRRVVAALAVLFILFVIVPPRALTFAKVVWTWLGTVCAFFKSTIGNCANLLIRAVGFLFSNWRAAVTKIWACKGFDGDLKRFSAQLIKSPIFWLLFLVCLYADARAVYVGLPEVFESQNSTVSGPVGLTAEFESTANAEQSTLASQTPHAPPGAYRYLQSLWLDGMLWIVALGISSMQAGIGLVLFWGIEEFKLLGTGFWTLARLRPIPLFSFTILTMALSLLALLRTWEHGPIDSDLGLPAGIAWLIAFAIPWIMAYVLHFAVESAADCLGPIKAILGVLLIVVCGLVIAVAVVGAIAAAMAGATILFCGAMIAGGFAALFLYSADLTSEAMVKTAKGVAAVYRALRDYRAAHRRTASPALATALSGFLLLLLYIFRKIKGGDL